MTAVNAGSRVRYTMRLGRHLTVALHGVVVTTEGSAWAWVQFEDQPPAVCRLALTRVPRADLTRRSADVVSIRRRAEAEAFRPTEPVA